ncbi:MAG TPA: HAD-IIIA family hydrolase [Candidatus Limnocylindrales bacterium]|nr:HAD-IIIA family hydrolase [Candidatus Limnocylindrales bacterium]
MKRAVFLDRDGVLNPMVERNGRWGAPLTLDAFALYPWTAESVLRLKVGGLLCLVATNQPEIATGELDVVVLEAMHRRLVREARIDGVYVCPHRDADGCTCRKPQPGLLEQAAREWGVGLAGSFLVGDRWRDIEAAHAAGCTAILVDGPESGLARPDHRVRDLREAVSKILTLMEGQS